MATGYDGGSSIDASSAALHCHGSDWQASGIRCNYMTLGRSRFTFATQPDTDTIESNMQYLATSPVSIEAWVRPRANGLTYGANAPDPFVADADACQMPFMVIGNNDYNITFIFRDAVGIGVTFFNTGDAAAQVATPFPTDMERWMYLVCNLDRPNLLMSFFLDGRLIGSAAITNNQGGSWINPEMNRWSGITNRASVPALGACATHQRLLTYAEIQNGFRNKTCNMLGPLVTEWSWDMRDVIFNGGISYAVDNAQCEQADANIGNALSPNGVSTETFRGVNADFPQMVPDRTGRNHTMHVDGPEHLLLQEGALGVDGIRFGWFDGR